MCSVVAGCGVDVGDPQFEGAFIERDGVVVFHAQATGSCSETQDRHEFLRFSESAAGNAPGAVKWFFRVCRRHSCLRRLMARCG